MQQKSTNVHQEDETVESNNQSTERKQGGKIQKSINTYQEDETIESNLQSTQQKQERNIQKSINTYQEDETVESSIHPIQRKQGGKMRRRNACVNRFDNIGISSPDLEPITECGSFSKETNKPSETLEQATNICRIAQLRTRSSQLISKDVIAEIKQWDEEENSSSSEETNKLSKTLQQATTDRRIAQLRMRSSKLISKDVIAGIKQWDEEENSSSGKSPNDQTVEITKLDTNILKSGSDPKGTPKVSNINTNFTPPSDDSQNYLNDIILKKIVHLDNNFKINETSTGKKTTEDLNMLTEESRLTKSNIGSSKRKEENSDSHSEFTKHGAAAHFSQKNLNLDIFSKINESKIELKDDTERLWKLNTHGNHNRTIWSSFSGTEQIIGVAKDANKKILQIRTDLLSEHDKGRKQQFDKQEIPTQAESSTKRTEEISASEKNIIAKNNEEKTVSLSKDDFLKMNVIGQFNLGFILARCENNHLWILDQHACDEKYNFEKIAATTKFHEQKLIAPLPLELSPSEEDCIVENMDLFEEHGFRFQYDSKKPPRHRLSLTALPHSGSGGDGRKAVQFGKEDVGAFCAILGADGASSSAGIMSGSGTGADGSGSSGNNAVRRYAGSNGGAVIRLPKVVAMFASRACRGSIMIGDALSHSQMEKIIRRLHKVEQPWNCPHGRPTMRHVKNVTQVLIEDEVVKTTLPALRKDSSNENN